MSSKIRANLSKWLMILCVTIFAIIYMAPVAIAILNSFKSKGEIIISAISLPKHISFANYIEVLCASTFLPAFFNSLFITLVSMFFIIFISTLAGYGIARWNSKIGNIIMMVFLVSMFIPFEAYMISLVKIAFNLKLTRSSLGLIVVYIGLGVPTPIFLFRGFIKSLPYEIEEAALIDGCTIFQRFFKIVLPLLKPVISTVAVLNFLWIWNDFLLPSLILQKPITIPLSQASFFGQYNQQWHLIMANFVITSIPAIIFFLIMQKSVVKGLVSGAIKG